MLNGFMFIGFQKAVIHDVEAIERVEIAEAARPVPKEAVPDLKAPKVAVNAPAPVKVAMDIKGEYTLNGEKLNEAALSKKLAALVKAHPQQRVIVEADSRAPVQMIANAMKVCKNAGVTNVAFSAKSIKPSGNGKESP